MSSSPLRRYEPHELGPDGYPRAWHRNCDGAMDAMIFEALEQGWAMDFVAGIKHLVRAEAGERCVRCHHPYRVGESGIMEPISTELAELAADVDATPDVLDRALELADDQSESPVLADLRAADIARAKRTHWSPCDQHCEHGGPVRFRMRGTDEWGQLNERELPIPIRDIGIRTVDWQLGQRTGEFEVQASWRILGVLHLNGRKEDCRWHNLVALCQRLTVAT